MPNGLIVYGEQSNTTPRYRLWDGENFGTEYGTQTANYDIAWAVVKYSPDNTEAILGVLETGSSTLWIQTWNGTSWTSNWSTVLGDSAYRKFDIAFEQRSGDVIVVFSDTDKKIWYRKRIDGVWDASNQLLTDTLNDICGFIQLRSTNTNDIFLAGLDVGKVVHVWRWDGDTNTFGDYISISNLASGIRKSFCLSFEKTTGNGWFFWGDESSNLKYRRYTTSWQTEVTAYSGLDDNAIWVCCANDPTSASNNIAIAMVCASGVFEFGMWNGSTFETRPATITARDKTQRGIEVAWENQSGKAMYIFNQSANPKQMAWRTWTSSGGWGSVTAETGTAPGDLYCVQIHYSPKSKGIMILYHDSSRNLFHRCWDGVSWSALTTALETNLSQLSQREPYSFDCKVDVRKQGLFFGIHF